MSSKYSLENYEHCQQLSARIGNITTMTSDLQGAVRDQKGCWAGRFVGGHAPLTPPTCRFRCAPASLCPGAGTAAQRTRQIPAACAGSPPRAGRRATPPRTRCRWTAGRAGTAATDCPACGKRRWWVARTLEHFLVWCPVLAALGCSTDLQCICSSRAQPSVIFIFKHASVVRTPQHTTAMVPTPFIPCSHVASEIWARQLSTE